MLVAATVRDLLPSDIKDSISYMETSHRHILLSNKHENSAMLRNAFQVLLLSQPELEFIFNEYKPHRV